MTGDALVSPRARHRAEPTLPPQPSLTVAAPTPPGRRVLARLR